MVIDEKWINSARFARPKERRFAIAELNQMAIPIATNQSRRSGQAAAGLT
jgi:hypothetical protein